MSRIRLYRGGLDESLETAEEFKDRAEFVTYVRKHWGPWGEVQEDTISTEPYGGDDTRIGWKDCHIVLVDRAPFGFCEGPMPAPPVAGGK